MSRAAQGLRAWLLQRFTAIYLAVYLIGLAVYVGVQTPFDYPRWFALFADPRMAVATVLFVLALLLHVWVGVRDVLIDYVQIIWLRLLCMGVAALLLLASLLWIVRALSLATAAYSG